MVDKVETAIVRLWGDRVGAVAWLEDRGHGEEEDAQKNDSQETGP